MLRQLIIVTGEPGRLHALNQFGRVISSSDGGKSWGPFTGVRKPTSDAERHGQALYATHCKSCHGRDGVGETYIPDPATAENYLVAPALDDSTHAWHHSDEDLVKMILEGSPRSERMPGFAAALSAKDAADIVAYMKSLWGARALECQGPKHMQCM